MNTPTLGQLALLMLAAAILAGSLALSLWNARSPRSVARDSLLAIGLALGIAVLFWHARTRGDWFPLTDNFDALVWLALLLVIFVLYLQRARPLAGLDWFLLPVALLTLLGAAAFGRTMPRGYDVRGTWLVAHWVTAYGSAVAFAIAAAVGAMYLIVNRRLRSKSPTTGPSLGSLERLESLTLTSVTLGFALLTVALVTGLIRILSTRTETSLGEYWYMQPKVLLAILGWLVYGVVLHSPINPSFRGRKAAWLSVAGFLIVIGSVVATQFMPRGGVR